MNSLAGVCIACEDGEQAICRGWWLRSATALGSLQPFRRPVLWPIHSLMVADMIPNKDLGPQVIRPLLMHAGMLSVQTDVRA